MTIVESLQDTSIVATRKPRIALMGEFSAGKSTLMNLLLGCDPMPVQITATRVPPVWVTYGAHSATLVHEDGGETQFDGSDLSAAPMQGTSLIRFSMDSDILNLCDLIDIPGISDPNQKHESWLDLVADMDCVIWCTHATQAWRQSEAALWEQICASVPGPNHLVVTQIDKLRTELDRRRVLARLEAEAGAAFASILPIATLDAINAGMDETAWRNSGGAALIEQLVTMLVGDAETPVRQDDLNEPPIKDTQAPSKGIAAGGVTIIAASNTLRNNDGPDACTEAGAQKKVVPRRVRPKTPTPDRPSDAATHSVPQLDFGRIGDP
ncbi:dynamin family protein [Shimia sp.]|uniref:dynamin family protein n=1 Tax=Shimia sp. TaxID=1954381 RepID=UPI003B8C0167